MLGSESANARRAVARGYRYGVPVDVLITLVAFLSPLLSLIVFAAFAGTRDIDEVRIRPRVDSI